MDLTQNELANLFNISLSKLQELEYDSSAITDDILKKYMCFFNVVYDDIFLGVEYENNVLNNRKRKA